METAPQLHTAPHLLTVLAELQRLEPLYHAACPEATPEWFETIVAPEFWEIGASGRPYSRAFALSALRDRPATPEAENWQTSDFHVMPVGAGNLLLTYKLTQPGRVTLRSTVWRPQGETFLAVFHQGTPVVV